MEESRQDPGRLRFWAGTRLSAVLGLLLTVTMPKSDVGLLGWLGLVPLWMTVATAPTRHRHVLTLPFGLIWSIACGLSASWLAPVSQLGMSARAFHRILQLARTIVDFEGVPDIQTHQSAEAIRYKPWWQSQYT